MQDLQKATVQLDRQVNRMDQITQLVGQQIDAKQVEIDQDKESTQLFSLMNHLMDDAAKKANNPEEKS